MRRPSRRRRLVGLAILGLFIATVVAHEVAFNAGLAWYAWLLFVVLVALLTFVAGELLERMRR